METSLYNICHKVQLFGYLLLLQPCYSTLKIAREFTYYLSIITTLVVAVLSCVVNLKNIRLYTFIYDYMIENRIWGVLDISRHGDA